MRKSKLITFLLILAMGGSMAFAGSETMSSSAEMAVPVTEYKSMESEVNTMNKRLEEIRDMDRAEMAAKDKKEIKKELKEMKKKKNRGGIYIGGGTLILLVILIAIIA